MFISCSFIISQHWYIYINASSWKTDVDTLSFKVKTMAVVGLTTQGTRALTTMVLAYFPWTISPLHQTVFFKVFLLSCTQVNFTSSSKITKKYRHFHALNLKIVPCTFHGPGMILGYQIFGVTVPLYSLLECTMGIFRLWICFRVFNVCSKIPKMRPCTWCVLPRGDSSPLRRWLGSCPEMSFQRCHTLTHFSSTCNSLVSDYLDVNCFVLVCLRNLDMRSVRTSIIVLTRFWNGVIRARQSNRPAGRPLIGPDDTWILPRQYEPFSRLHFSLLI